MRHLEIFVNSFGCPSFFLSADKFLDLQARNLSTEKRFLFSEVILLIKIVLTATATFTISERRSSTLNGIKTSISSTIRDSRPNHPIIIRIYHEELLDINIKLIRNKVKWSSPELLLSGCINFEHLLTLVSNLLSLVIYYYCLTHLLLLYAPFQYRLNSSENRNVFLCFWVGLKENIKIMGYVRLGFGNPSLLVGLCSIPP